jgi:hypothetical protein
MYMIISLIPDLHGQVFESAQWKKEKELNFKNIYVYIFCKKMPKW